MDCWGNELARAHSWKEPDPIEDNRIRLLVLGERLTVCGHTRLAGTPYYLATAFFRAEPAVSFTPKPAGI